MGWYRSPKETLKPSRRPVVMKMDRQLLGFFLIKYRSLLKVRREHLTLFGLSKLKPFQKDAIQSVELRKDSVIVQPTASGKSMCYLLPVFFEKGKITVVVSPTISLINSQIEHLTHNGIEAASVGPSSGSTCIQSITFDEANAIPSIVFTTPEYFAKKLKNELLQLKQNIKLLVLDEIHKMFDRSSDFRSSYDTFKSLRSHLKTTPIMALTATLNDPQLRDLCLNYLRCPVLIRSSINKRNKKLNITSYGTVNKKSGCEMWKNVVQHIVNTVDADYAIVCMDFKKDIELLVGSIQDCGISLHHVALSRHIMVD